MDTAIISLSWDGYTLLHCINSGLGKCSILKLSLARCVKSALGCLFFGLSVPNGYVMV